jgi:hypothetical protein
MNQNLEPHEHEQDTEHSSSGVNRLLIGAVVAMLVVAGLAIGYGYRQQAMVGHLTAQESMANATIGEMQGQLNTVTAKLNDVTAAQQAATEAQAKEAAARANGAKTGGAKGTSASSKRLKEFQAKLDDQQKQLKDTQDQVAKNRADLEGSLSSTKDELNGSIAKPHEELVALAKRGERSYFEFDLTKSKQFQRVGPLTLSLRKADTKRKSYDLQMIVDDNKLTKKNVNLYEPIWIHTENESQPVQVVVNRVDKNLVHGYVSAPKYKPSELAASSTTGAAVTPVSEHPQEPQPEQNPEIPKEPQ